MSEIWKPVPGFSGYEASNHGRVRSYYKRGGSEGWTITDTPQRFLCTDTEVAHRYAAINLVADGGGQIPMKVHNAVLLAFVGQPPAGMEACHNDGDSTNNHLTNLRYGSHTANMVDSYLHGNRMFDVEQIIEMRQLAINGMTAAELAERYGASRQHISDICHGRKYRKVAGPTVDRMAYPKGTKRSKH